MMTVPQLFLSVLGFILFIVLGIVFIRRWGCSACSDS